MDLKLDPGYRDPLGFSLSEHLEPTQSWKFNRRIRIRSPRDIEAAVDLIAQAYESLAGR